MRRLLLFLAPFLLGACALGQEQRYTHVVDKTIDSVVRIEVVAFDNGEIEQRLGAGVLLSSRGHIVTCQHVIAGLPVVIDVRLHSSSATLHHAIILRRDFKRDLALLQIVDSPTTPFAPLSNTKVRQGDEVVAIGHPLSQEWSVTTGVVSGMGREGLAINLLQTDAAINPGNSGGPLFNMDGEVVGINESVYLQANTLGFAVPTEEVKEFLQVFDGLQEVIRHD